MQDLSFSNNSELQAMLGLPLGPSHWILVDQAMISEFGRVSLDPDPLHIDPEWAKLHSPFGSTIAFGFLTVALLTTMLHSATKTTVHFDPLTTGIFLNYGFDRMRLISPVPVGSYVRGRFQLDTFETDQKGRLIATFDCLVDIKDQERPALSARWVTLWVPPEK